MKGKPPKEKPKPPRNYTSGIGTVVIFGATLKVKHPSFWEQEEITKFMMDAADVLGLSIRTFSYEDYETPKNAFTYVAFLSESHMMLTSYPESSLMEFEVGSCKFIEVGACMSWLTHDARIEVQTAFIVDKNKEGNWTRSV